MTALLIPVDVCDPLALSAAVPFPPDLHPVKVYLVRLGSSSRCTMRAALEGAARLLTNGRRRAEEVPWPGVSAHGGTKSPAHRSLFVGELQLHSDGRARGFERVLAAREHVAGGPGERRRYSANPGLPSPQGAHAGRERARTPLRSVCPGHTASEATGCTALGVALRSRPAPERAGPSQCQ